VTGWPSLLVSMCDAVLQHTVAYSSKLFSCVVTKRISLIEFSATKIDITVQLVGALPSHLYLYVPQPTRGLLFFIGAPCTFC